MDIEQFIDKYLRFIYFTVVKLYLSTFYLHIISLVRRKIISNIVMKIKDTMNTRNGKYREIGNINE